MLRRLWLPTSEKQLLASQDALLRHFVSRKLTNRRIVLPASGLTINAVDTMPGSSPASGARTLVVGHGLGSGLGFFFNNIDAFAEHFDRVVAFDWLGFGGSSRPMCNAAPRRRSRALTSFCASDGDFESASAAAAFFVDSFHSFLHHPEIGLAGEP